MLPWQADRSTRICRFRHEAPFTRPRSSPTRVFVVRSNVSARSDKLRRGREYSQPIPSIRAAWLTPFRLCARLYERKTQGRRKEDVRHVRKVQELTQRSQILGRDPAPAAIPLRTCCVHLSLTPPSAHLRPQCGPQSGRSARRDTSGSSTDPGRCIPPANGFRVRRR
jgi:hypothetical protein